MNKYVYAFIRVPTVTLGKIQGIFSSFFKVYFTYFPGQIYVLLAGKCKFIKFVAHNIKLSQVIILGMIKFQVISGFKCQFQGFLTQNAKFQAFSLLQGCNGQFQGFQGFQVGVGTLC